MGDSNLSEVIPIHWPGEKGRSSFRAPKGTKKRMDDFLECLQEKTGVKFTRNHLIMRAVQHYYKYCHELAVKKGYIERPNPNEDQDEQVHCRDELDR